MHLISLYQWSTCTYFSLGLDTDHLPTLIDNLLHWLVQHVCPTIDGTQPVEEERGGGKHVGGWGRIRERRGENSRGGGVEVRRSGGKEEWKGGWSRVEEEWR